MSETTSRPNAELAIHGGTPAISIPGPHWQWPPKSKGRAEAACHYLMHGKENESGYPDVVEAFEKKFAAFCDRTYALALNSGTSALHAAYFAAGVKSGDEVIVPTLTFHATATPVLQLGARPVFCDASPDTGNIDPVDLEGRITSKTKAIGVTHLCGHPCDMPAIMEVAGRHGIPVIEDCSHAHGSSLDGKKTGTFADIAIFSMDNKKILATGEGGVLVTDRLDYFERSLVCSDFGARLNTGLTLPETRRYFETGLGCKHRIHPLSAALAIYELDQLDGYCDMRLEKLNRLSARIEALPGLRPPVTRDGATRGAYFGYRPFYVAEELGSLPLGDFLAALHGEGMEVRQSGNPPLHQLPLFMDRDPSLKNLTLPQAEKFFDTTLSLPTFTLEPDELVDQYALAFEKVCHYFARNP